ncbi:phage regulatory CII family protein [Vibrio sp. PP-XX7]
MTINCVPNPCISQVVSACQLTLKSFGAEKLAQLLGKNTTVLRNEINPNQHGHKLGLLDALRVMQLTGDVQILRALAGELNYSIISLAITARFLMSSC